MEGGLGDGILVGLWLKGWLYVRIGSILDGFRFHLKNWSLACVFGILREMIEMDYSIFEEIFNFIDV